MKPGAKKIMTVRLPADLSDQLEKLIQVTGWSKSDITIAALHAYVKGEFWKIEQIGQGVAEADRGEFASDSEVSSFFAKYSA